MNEKSQVSQRARINLVDAVLDVAPPPPPCFLNRQSWIEYLQSAAGAQNQRTEPKVIIMLASEPAMNPDFPFCVDCTQVKSFEMTAQGKCHPAYLKDYYTKMAVAA